MHASTHRYSPNITVWLLLFTISVSGPLSTLVTASAHSSEHRTTNINSTSAPEPDQRARVIQAFGKLPLSFEINQGQADNQVSFLSHGSGYDLFLTSNEAVLSLNVPSAQQPSTASSMRSKNLKTDPPTHTKQDVLRMKLMGANSEWVWTSTPSAAGWATFR